MLSADDVIVLSDLHLAAAQGCTLSHADDELAAFLNWVGRRSGRHTLMIINGDWLDYLTIGLGDEPFSAFDPDNAIRRTDAIMGSHKKIFAALRQITCSRWHHLAVLAGNHDPELALLPVQRRIEEALTDIGLSQPVRWLVDGEAVECEVGGARVLIEHGDLYDDWNWIDHEKLGWAISRASRGCVEDHGYKPPPGSQLVVKHLNPLRRDYPWIGWLKPELKAVIPIIATSVPFEFGWRLLRASRSLMDLSGRVLRRKFWELADPTRNLAREDRPAVAPGTVQEPGVEGEIDLELLSIVEEQRTEDFRAWVTETLERDLQRGLVERAQEWIGQTIDDALIAWLKKITAEDGFFKIGGVDKNAGAADYLIKQKGVDLVVHGHTHAAKAYRIKSGLYLNTGTWTNLVRLPETSTSNDKWREFIGALRQGQAQPVARHTFVQISGGNSGAGAAASLQEWKAGEPQPLVTWTFDRSKRRWKMEG